MKVVRVVHCLHVIFLCSGTSCCVATRRSTLTVARTAAGTTERLAKNVRYVSWSAKCFHFTPVLINPIVSLHGPLQFQQIIITVL